MIFNLSARGTPTYFYFLEMNPNHMAMQGYPVAVGNLRQVWKVDKFKSISH